MAEKDTESHPIDPPIEVDIPGYSEKTHFYTWEELRDFIESENIAWAWVSESNRQREPPPIGQVSSHYRSTLNSLRSWINLDTTPPGFTQHRQQIENALDMYRKGDLLCAKSADGQFIISLAEDDPSAALGALASLGTQKWPLHDQSWQHVLRGATQLATSRLDKKGAVARATKALDDLRSEWAARLDEEKSLLEELRGEVRTELNTTQGDITTAQKRVSKFWIDQGNSVRDFYRKARSDKDNLENAFIEHMRLKAPANYWRKKAIAHLIWVASAFISFAAASAFAARMLIDNASFILALVQPANDGGFPWGNVVIITLPALAFFWFLRFIARVFVTNLQRHQDARERATMVQTYLALVKEGENVATPDERILVLNALFRPGPGDAPDEAPPADLLDIIKRAPKQ